PRGTCSKRRQTCGGHVAGRRETLARREARPMWDGTCSAASPSPAHRVNGIVTALAPLHYTDQIDCLDCDSWGFTPLLLPAHCPMKATILRRRGRRRLWSVALGVSLAAQLLIADTTANDNLLKLPTEAVRNHGTLIIVGGGNTPQEAKDEFLRLAGG